MSEYLQSHENEFQYVFGDLKDKFEQLKLSAPSGSELKSAIARIDDSVEESLEILERMQSEVQGIPTNQRSQYNTKIRGFRRDVDAIKRESRKLADESSRSQLFGSRGGSQNGIDSAGYSDDASEQRQQLLNSQQRLERSSDRLREAQRVGNETEQIGAGILNDLRGQREQIVNSRNTLTDADSYIDKSLRTLRSMARRMAANRMISYAIIAVLILLIVFVLASKFM